MIRILIVSLCFIGISCMPDKKKEQEKAEVKKTEIVTESTLNIAAPAEIYSLLEKSIQSFRKQNSKIRVSLSFCPSDSAISWLVKKKADICFSMEKLTPKEQKIIGQDFARFTEYTFISPDLIGESEIYFYLLNSDGRDKNKKEDFGKYLFASIKQ